MEGDFATGSMHYKATGGTWLWQKVRGVSTGVLVYDGRLS